MGVSLKMLFQQPASRRNPLKILSFDTSSSSGSIALTEDGNLVGEVTVGKVGAYSEWLVKGIDDFLKALGVSIEGIDLFAVGAGPGSFTGLRIGVSVAKGLAWAAGRPVVGVSTLHALAMNIQYTDFRVCPVLDAKKKEVYAALFASSDGEARRVVPDCAVRPERLIEIISEKGGGPVVFLGSALRQYENFLRENLADAIIASRHLWEVRAANIGLLAGKSAVFHDPAQLAPAYFRRSEAELKKAEKEGVIGCK